jgi:hypothetical protein
MKRVAATLAPFILCAAAAGWAAQVQQSGSQPVTLALPAGTKIELVVTAPIWARSVKAGDPLYAVTDFPVSAGGAVAIPAGTFIQGTIQSVTRPTRKLSRAEIDVLFTKIIFLDGYTIDLPGEDGSVVIAPPAASDSPAAGVDANNGPEETAAKLTVEVSLANDLLLDNGTQLEMTLGSPLSLDAREVSGAIPLTHGPAPGSFKTATLCQPTEGIPGSPGTPDTVIPGTPGTPSTTIPGGPGMPDITIPGTPGTPPTIIPGTPGTPDTPGTTCPAAPIVIASEPITLKPVQTQSEAPATKQ